MRLQNPWWATGKVPENRLGNIKRGLFEEVIGDLSSKKITGVVGPRRSGKTTFLHNLINELISKGTDPKRIFYLQLDNATIENPITELTEYISESLGQLEKLKSKIYIFLDEIHKIKNWENEIKQWQDLNLNIKFIISGSSARGILKGSGEGLVGRVNYFLLLPLSFKELVKHKYGIEINSKLNQEDIKKHYTKLSVLGRIDLEFANYLLRGGYPETTELDIEKAFRTLLDYKDLSLQKDLFESEEIRDAKSVKELIRILASLVVERINYSKIGSAIGIKNDTVKKYIGFLEDIYLVKEMKVFSKKPFFSVRKERKIVFLDTGMLNALNMKYEADGEYLSKLVENLVCRAIFEISTKKEMSPELFYWIDEYGKEVDCILEIGGTIPVEVKYRNNVSEDDLVGIIKFMDKFKLKRGIVVTKNTLKEETFKSLGSESKSILFIPAWIFVLVVGIDI